jgi:hypothetical protein
MKLGATGACLLPDSYVRPFFMPEHRSQRIHPDGDELGHASDFMVFQAAAVLKPKEQLPA